MKPANPSLLAEDFQRTGRSDSCPVIDIHGHLGPYQGIYFPSADTATMVASMKRAGVVSAVCSSHESLYDTQPGNERMARAVREFPDELKGYWTVNPNDPDLMEHQLAELEGRNEFVGIKLHPTMHNYPLTGEAYTPVYEYALKNHIPVLSHTWGNNNLCGAGTVRAVCEQYPDLIFLMGHSCYGEWENAIQLAVDFKNVYLELTAAYVVNGIIEQMVEHAGSHKVLYGTDMPWFDPHFAIGCILHAHITDDDRHNILHRNASKLLTMSSAKSRYSDRGLM